MKATMVLKLAGLLVLAGAVVLLLGRYAGLDLGFQSRPASGIEGALVRRGPLRISVIERANLKADKSINLKCELEGRSTILWLIEEGAIVAEGELVCQLDTSTQVQRRVEQEIAVQNADASFVTAKQNLAIQESQNESDVKRAEQELLFAEKDRVKYIEGEYPQSLQAADEEILLAEEDATRKESELEWSRRLAEKGFLTRTQLDADEFAYNSAKVKLEQARRAKALLIEHDHPRKLLELEAAAAEAGRELERVKLQAMARVTDFQSDVRASEAKLNLERDELAKLVSQIEKAEMRAPVAGMVVYAKENGRWGGGEPIQEGTEVRERQDIITIPSSQGMVAEMSLHESVLERVTEGMPCILTVDALGTQPFTGRVRFKSTLPDQNSWWANPDLRVYRTEVEVAETDPGLKTGMSCQVEVVVADLADVLHVPVQSIFLDAGKPVAFVARNGEAELRQIEVGLDNGKWVEVRAGLAEGEVVLLAQPPGSRLEPALEAEVELDAIPPIESSGDGAAPVSGQPPLGEKMPEHGKRPEGSSGEHGGRAVEGARGPAPAAEHGVTAPATPAAGATSAVGGAGAAGT
jgi:HlyD family secretion protein